MSVQPMSTTAEARICRAIVDVADHVEAGDAPNSAIAKAASTAGVPRGHLGLMVHAYNIGRTNRQREDGTTPAEKAAAFPIATIDGVMAVLYPDEPATKAASERATGVDAVYSSPPKRSTVAPMVKAAHVVAPPTPVSHKTPMEIAVRRSEKRARVLTEARRIEVVAKDKFRAAVVKLAQAFDEPGRPGIADVRKNVEILHGSDGIALLDHIVDGVPRLAKYAAATKFATHAVTDYPHIYGSLTAAIVQAENVAEVQRWRSALIKEAETLDLVELSAYKPAPRSALEIIDLENAIAEKRAGLDMGDRLLGPNVSNALSQSADAFHGGEPERAAERALGRIATPEHEQNLRAIQARAMLHEMLHDDEILRGRDPYEVARHFNRLSQYAPRVAEQPLAAIPAVRKSVQQGHLDSFDVRELADTESKLKGVHAHGGQSHAK